MILLDTDHLTVLKYRDSERYAELTDRLRASNDTVGTTVVNVEEQMRGWLAAIAKEKKAVRQVLAYRELADLFAFFAKLEIAAFSEAAAEEFENLRSARVRIGTMDLKIAAIAIAHGARLLSANRKDFQQVPGLQFENWLV
jgi:tRNA(fMet)-specific endonuclease VapC